MIQWLIKLFPLWAILLSTVAFFSPGPFSAIKSAIIPLLTVVMFGMGMMIICSVILHNLIGLFCGYWVPRFLGYDDQICRTLSIEVGMQNSGLSVALAVKYFSVVAAIPGAIFSIWHNLSGSFLAGYWSSKSERAKMKALMKN